MSNHDKEFDEYMQKIERDLYDALEALDSGDLITIRQCSARVKENANSAWQCVRAVECMEKSNEAVLI